MLTPDFHHDVCLECIDGEVVAHRVILSIHSEVMENMLYNKNFYNESEHQIIKVKCNFNKEIVQEIINNLYQQNINIDNINIQKLIYILEFLDYYTINAKKFIHFFYKNNYSELLNVTNKLPEHYNNIIRNIHTQNTDLFKLIKESKSELLHEYVDIGCDVNIILKNHETIIHSIMNNLHNIVDGVKLLRKIINRASNETINYKDKIGQTPLMIAIRKKLGIGMIAYLVDSGADISIKSTNNRDAIDWAIVSGDRNVIKYLITL